MNSKSGIGDKPLPIIDASGLFAGDRFELCSDEARLFWPHFWCASNAFGRIEINYHKIVSMAFHKWKKPPSEEVFMRCMMEYQECHLLFVYEDGGELWGQWDTEKKFLPTYQSAVDKRSPSPDGAAFDKWKAEYVEYKRAKERRQSSVKLSERFQKDLGKVSEIFPSGIGVGVRDLELGNGNGVEPCATALAVPRVAVMKPPVDEVAEWYNNEFYPIFPLHKAREEGLTAARKQLRSKELRDCALTALREQIPELMSKEKRNRPYPATWINGRRWEDEILSPSPLFQGPYKESIADQMTRVVQERLQRGERPL